VYLLQYVIVVFISERETEIVQSKFWKL
jgi:hypothetical protein